MMIIPRFVPTSLPPLPPPSRTPLCLCFESIHTDVIRTRLFTSLGIIQLRQIDRRNGSMNFRSAYGTRSIDRTTAQPIGQLDTLTIGIGFEKLISRTVDHGERNLLRVFDRIEKPLFSPCYRVRTTTNDQRTCAYDERF